MSKYTLIFLILTFTPSSAMCLSISKVIDVVLGKEMQIEDLSKKKAGKLAKTKENSSTEQVKMDHEAPESPDFSSMAPSYGHNN